MAFMATSAINPFESAKKQLKAAAGILRLDKKTVAVLSQPERELSDGIPVRMDDGSTQNFNAMRVAKAIELRGGV